MKIEKGTIMEATELELYDYYLTRSFDDLYSFPDFKFAMKLAGTIIVD